MPIYILSTKYRVAGNISRPRKLVCTRVADVSKSLCFIYF
jgi:hypothetical protein